MHGNGESSDQKVDLEILSDQYIGWYGMELTSPDTCILKADLPLEPSDPTIILTYGQRGASEVRYSMSDLQLTRGNASAH